MGLVRDNNRPGRGGLYDQIVGDARRFQQSEAKRNEKNLVEQMALLQMSMDQQRRQYTSDLQALRNTLNASSNPRLAEQVLGIKAAGKMKGKGGMRGAFSRGGNRIKGLKLNNINI